MPGTRTVRAVRGSRMARPIGVPDMREVRTMQTSNLTACEAVLMSVYMNIRVAGPPKQPLHS